MIVEWLTTWIATKAVGFLVKTIISKEFVEDLVKDYAKDFFKSILNNAVTAPFKQEPLQKAEVMALAEFVQLMQQDLEDGELAEDDIKKYTQPIKQFIKNQEVKQILGNAFKHDCQAIDTKKLQEIWYQLNSSNDFKWKPIGTKYLQKVKEIIIEVDELREILNSQNLDKIAQNTTEIAGIIPQFDLEKYQETIRERYGNLKLDNLDTTGYAYNELKLWKIFIAQNVKEDNQVLRKVHELPKERQRRLRDAEFRHFILQDLEAEQIQDFIYRWHELTFNDEADKLRKRERLQRGIAASKSIAELAGNPLLLTMMAILNRNQELPRDRAELYNQASRVLLHQWDVERALIEDKRLDPKTIDYKDKQAMLRQVAYYMQTSDKGLAGNLISAGDLEKILTDYLKTIEFDKPREAAKVMINQLRTRNFMLCFLGADYYAFVHRTFLEYFCAWEFVWQFKETQALTIEELKIQVFGKHWDDPVEWFEILSLIVSMIEPKFAGEIIDYLIAQGGAGDDFLNISLAIDFLLEIKNRSAITSVENRLIEYIKDLINFKYGDMDMLDDIHTRSISWIITYWKTHPETLPWLKTLIHYDNAKLDSLFIDEYYEDAMQFDKIKTIQITAVQKMAQGWKNDPDTLPMLKNLIISNSNDFVKDTAVQELARGWKDDPDTLLMLKTLLSSSNNSVQVTALQELTRGWKDDADTLPMLKALALSNDENINKIAVIRELARGWKDDPHILSILKTCLEYENDSFLKDMLRETLMEELIQGWQPNPDIYDFIYNCANDNSFDEPFIFIESDKTNPRQVALLAIIEQYPDHPQTLPLLRDKAENDPDEKVREFAQNKLKELGEAK